jgi:hypothetical protein
MTPAWALDITFNAGVGTPVTIADNGFGDLNAASGTIDFNQTVESIFEVKGRAEEDIGPVARTLTLTATPPDPGGTFRNIGGIDGNFTVTINSSPFASVGPPLGWRVQYNGSADDPTPGGVNIASHSVQALINGGAISLVTVAGTAITVADDISLDADGVHPTANATDMSAVFAFSPGPGDRILLPNSIEVTVFDQTGRCIDRMNNDARKVAAKAQTSDGKCARTSGNVTTCVDNPFDAGTESKEAKLFAHFNDFCDPVPAWGVNGSMCCDDGANDGAACTGNPDCPSGFCLAGACISGAADHGANDLTHDLFGATVFISGGRLQKNCQRKLLQAAGRLYSDQWKVFRTCKKRSFGTITNDTDLVNVCLGPPQPDPNGKIARRVGKIASIVLNTCAGKGITPVGNSFPGECTAEPNGTFDDCVKTRTSCRFCLAVNVADDIDPPLDCDQFDDGTANSSCP